MKVIALFSALLMSAALNANPMLYRYHIPESAQDHRYDYHWALLKLALEQTSEQYGDYQLEPAPLVMSESRQFQALGGPLLSVMISPADIENEKRFLPVRIPLDKGLIGYRVLLIRKERQAEFSRINNLEQLRKLTVGQGRDWRDVRVWQDNGFEVVQGSNYNGLFQMLLSGRFDFFSRSIVEVQDELAQRRQQMPDLAIEKSILIYYPWPFYFYFARTDAGQKLADRVQVGLMKVFNDPVLFEPLFNRFNGATLAQLNLQERHVFYLENPFLSAETPLQNPELWLDPFNRPSH
ncbi:MAG: amino acid ABC transporter substrate-binding protein [Pseudomonadota bacterium]|uniref:hypothetical protein n=1 Tax=Gallaecimonas pentaromativorans TaxID=584787 RepID=UPI00067EAFBC|nr:hypothetical protein [Gallaecimonas pentaromativorans]MED5523646.1 amino acid ABC transporter substrate-binding protein [Pseudomonadota bacterium]